MLNKNEVISNITYTIIGYILSLFIILLYFTYIQNNSIKILKIKNEQKKKEVSYIMSLPEQINSERYSCSFVEGVVPYEEQMKCNEIMKVNIGQTPNGEYYFGLQR
jgi:hypothetical protein